MTFEHCVLAGVLKVRHARFEDPRGTFVKTFHEKIFCEQGITFSIAEQFYSTSSRDVLRGMHYQAPPHDHGKLVTCVRGRILDVALDLRQTSATSGQSAAFELDGESPSSIWIPPGLAHGFLALTEGALVLYNVTSVHTPSADAGVRWDSFGFVWPCAQPILSERDATFPALAEFVSPFTL